MSADHTIYGQALAEAETELANITAQFDQLAKRKSQLEAFILNAAPLVPKVAEPAHDVVVMRPQKNIPVPIWKSIVHAINGKGESFTVRDANDALERIGRGIASPNRFQIVRNVLVKKTENFEALGNGVFRVKQRDTKGAQEETPA